MSAFEMDPEFRRAIADDETPSNPLLARLYYLRCRGLAYASSIPCVNALLADMANGLAEAAQAIEAAKLARREDRLDRTRARSSQTMRP
jgi:hypothetical protein